MLQRAGRFILTKIFFHYGSNKCVTLSSPLISGLHHVHIIHTNTVWTLSIFEVRRKELSNISLPMIGVYPFNSILKDYDKHYKLDWTENAKAS